MVKTAVEVATHLKKQMIRHEAQTCKPCLVTLSSENAMILINEILGGTQNGKK